MNIPLRLWRLGKAHAFAEVEAALTRFAKGDATRAIAGLGVVRLVIAGAIGLSTSNGNRIVDLPIVPPTVSSDPTSERLDLSTTAGVDVKEDRQVRLHPTQIAVKEAGVAVSRSQAQLVQSRINSTKFQSKHNNTKILHRQGKVSRQQLNTAKSAHKLMQLQQSSASIGLQESQAQLIAAKAEVIKLGRKSNRQVAAKV